MCIICNTDYEALYKREEIDCNGCPLIEEIPYLPNLILLFCTDCKSLKKIPVLPNLQRLWCHRCPLLNEIPVLPNLYDLWCGLCPLKEVPILPKLTELYCCFANSVFQEHNIYEIDSYKKWLYIWLQISKILENKLSLDIIGVIKKYL